MRSKGKGRVSHIFKVSATSGAFASYGLVPETDNHSRERVVTLPNQLTIAPALRTETANKCRNMHTDLPIHVACKLPGCVSALNFPLCASSSGVLLLGAAEPVKTAMGLPNWSPEEVAVCVSLPTDVATVPTFSQNRVACLLRYQQKKCLPEQLHVQPKECLLPPTGKKQSRRYRPLKNGPDGIGLLSHIPETPLVLDTLPECLSDVVSTDRETEFRTELALHDQFGDKRCYTYTDLTNCRPDSFPACHASKELSLCPSSSGVPNLGIPAPVHFATGLTHVSLNEAATCFLLAACAGPTVLTFQEN